MTIMTPRQIKYLIILAIASSAPLRAQDKPRVAIIDFENKLVDPQTLYERQITAALQAIPTMLMSELDRTGQFRLLEREKLAQIKEELMRRNDPFFDQSSFPPLGKLVGAEYLITGALTDYDPLISGVQISARVPFVAQASGGVTFAFVRVELRLLNITTGEVAKTADAYATVPNIAGGVQVDLGAFELGSTAFKKTPLGHAFHEALEKAVNQLKEWTREEGAKP